MHIHKFLTVFIFLAILLITFILPMVLALNTSQYMPGLIIAIGMTIYLYIANFPIFVPALFFTLNYLFRPLQLWLIQTFNLGFPGLLYLASILVYLVIVLSIKKFRANINWLHMGKLNRITAWISIFLVIISAGALIAWAVFIQKDLGTFRKYLPDWRIGWLLLGGLGFAISNALVEEFLARALLWDAFNNIFGRIRWVNLAQAIIFCIWHYHGFPGGIIGMLMVFVWSLALGVLRHRTNGMLAPILAHFFADFSIFTILLAIL